MRTKPNSSNERPTIAPSSMASYSKEGWQHPYSRSTDARPLAVGLPNRQVISKLLISKYILIYYQQARINLSISPHIIYKVWLSFTGQFHFSGHNEWHPAMHCPLFRPQRMTLCNPFSRSSSLCSSMTFWSILPGLVLKQNIATLLKLSLNWLGFILCLQSYKFLSLHQ